MLLPVGAEIFRVRAACAGETLWVCVLLLARGCCGLIMIGGGGADKVGVVFVGGDGTRVTASLLFLS